MRLQTAPTGKIKAFAYVEFKEEVSSVSSHQHPCLFGCILTLVCPLTAQASLPKALMLHDTVWEDAGSSNDSKVHRMSVEQSAPPGARTKQPAPKAEKK